MTTKRNENEWKTQKGKNHSFITMGKKVGNSYRLVSLDAIHVHTSISLEDLYEGDLYFSSIMFIFRWNVLLDTFSFMCSSTENRSYQTTIDNFFLISLMRSNDELSDTCTILYFFCIVGFFSILHRRSSSSFHFICFFLLRLFASYCLCRLISQSYFAVRRTLRIRQKKHRHTHVEEQTIRNHYRGLSFLFFFPSSSFSFSLSPSSCNLSLSYCFLFLLRFSSLS